MPTEKYDFLKNRLFKLKKSFLPRQFSPTGNYAKSTYERIRGYKALAHAEVEYYIEELCLLVAQNAMNKWNSCQEVSKPLLAMVAYYTGQYKAVPSMRTDNRASEDLQERIKTAYSDYLRVRQKNHGIKEENILQLLLPLGFVVDDLDNNLVIALNNYGRERGDIVHSTIGETTSPDDALVSTEQLFLYLKTLDDLLIGWI